MTSQEEQLQRIETLLSENLKNQHQAKEDLRLEIEKVLEKKLGKIEKTSQRFKTEIQKKIDTTFLKNLRKIEAVILANQLAFHFLAPPITFTLLLVFHGVKAGTRIDFWKLAENPGKEIQRILTPNIQSASGDYSDSTKVTLGMTIEGFPVTSPMGFRKAPTAGASTFHKGIDLGTPVGIPIYSLGKMNVTCRYQDLAGNYALVDFPDQKKNFVLMHLSECTTGDYYKGQIFAKSGATGIGTGPHLHIEQYSGNVLENPTLGYVRGFLNPRYGTDEMTLAIGNAEGTLNSDGTKTKHWKSHIDPGNKAKNQGTFSYQHPAASPEEADRKQKAKLAEFREELLKEAKVKGYELSKLELMNGLDLFNQSELAAVGYVDRLIKSKKLVPDIRIVNARVDGYYKPNGQLDAPGFGNDLKVLHKDQVRRFEAIKKVLK